MKKLLIIVLPIAVISVGVVLALMGVVNIPGLTPKKKAVATAKAPEEPPKKPADVKPTESPKAPEATSAEEPQIETKPEEGAKRLARLWNEIDVAKLAEVVGDWKDEELVKVLAKMDNSHVAELLSTIDAKRASKLSRELQKAASIVPKTES